MDNNERIVMFECLAVSLIFGLLGVFIRELTELGFSSLQITVLRFGLTAAVLIIIALVADRSFLIIHKKDIWLFAVFGIVNIISFTMFSYANVTITMGLATVLIMTAPFYVVILSYILFRERITTNKIIAILVGLLGCLFVAGAFTNTFGTLEMKGILAGAISGIAYGIVLIGGKFFGKRGYQPETAVIYMSLFAGMFGLMFCDIPAFSKTIVSAGTSWILPSLNLAVLTTVIPYVVLYRAQKHISPGLVSVISTSEVIGSVVVGAWIYDEIVEIDQIIGIAAILISVLIMDLALCRDIKKRYKVLRSRFWKVFYRKPEG